MTVTVRPTKANELRAQSDIHVYEGIKKIQICADNENIIELIKGETWSYLLGKQMYEIIQVDAE